MGLISFLKEFFSTPVRYRSRPDGLRILDVPSGENVRELGGYRALGGMTRSNRYVRSGSTDYLLEKDMRALEHHGVTHVLDLRGNFERPAQTCHFAHRAGVRWVNVPLFGYDISDPKLRHSSHDEFEDYLVESYLTMLANHTAIRNIIEFLANVPEGQCALFHCAAGMDRTGIVALLLLGLAGVDRDHIIADYCYSFAPQAEVDAFVFAKKHGVDEAELHVRATPLRLCCAFARTLRRGIRLLGRATGNTRIHADDRDRSEELEMRAGIIATCYDRVIAGYESVEAYLLSCGLAPRELARIRVLLLG